MWAFRCPVWAERPRPGLSSAPQAPCASIWPASRELEIFTQFSSDLDQATQKTLDHGKHLLELLKQPLYQPMSVSRQAVLLYIGTNGLLDDVPVEQVRESPGALPTRVEREPPGAGAGGPADRANLSAVAIEAIPGGPGEL